MRTVVRTSVKPRRRLTVAESGRTPSPPRRLSVYSSSREETTTRHCFTLNKSPTSQRARASRTLPSCGGLVTSSRPTSARNASPTPLEFCPDSRRVSTRRPDPWLLPSWHALARSSRPKTLNGTWPRHCAGTPRQACLSNAHAPSCASAATYVDISSVSRLAPTSTRLWSRSDGSALLHGGSARSPSWRPQEYVSV